MESYQTSYFNLNLEHDPPGVVDVYLQPSAEFLETSSSSARKLCSMKPLLLEVRTDFLTMYPLKVTIGSLQFLKPKYDQVKAITLAGFDFGLPTTSAEVGDIISQLPAGFVHSIEYGLGLRKELNCIVEIIEAGSGCTEIVILADSDESAVSSPDIFYLTYDDFERLRKQINRISKRAQMAARNVKLNATVELLASNLKLTSKIPTIGANSVLHPFVNAAEGKSYLLPGEDVKLIEKVKHNTISLAKANPVKMLKLGADIELANLHMIIGQFELLLKKRSKESTWQKFLEINSFALSLAFGQPIVQVCSQAHVGGTNIEGKKGKIVDFLAKNSFSNNIALIEIKTPQTKLVSRQPYRGGVFGPSRELSAGIAQVLDQRYKLQSNIHALKSDSQQPKFETYAIHCCLIAGQMATFSEDELKSFELFRQNSKAVDVFTFDELLEKLQQLRRYLASD